jgi:putative transposase
LELFPYIHLNPLRASAVKSIDELDRYAWKGHAFLMGRRRTSEVAKEVVLTDVDSSSGC